MKNKKLIMSAAASLLGAMLLAGCSSRTPTVVNSVEPGYWEAQEKDKISGREFTVVGESENMQLLLNPKTATLRWLETETGRYQDTNLSADENLEKKSNNMQSDVIVSYYSGTDSNLYQTSTNYDSFSMGSNRGQVDYQLMDNGVRVIYGLGDDAMTYKNFPQDITNERMEEFVLQYMTDVQKDQFSQAYYTQLSSGNWHRKSNKDAPLGPMQVNELNNYFYVNGAYTEEELYADLEAFEVDPEEYPSNLMIRFAVEYYLDGDDLVVNLDASKIETEKEHPIRSIVLLPYFMTSATDQDAEEGYMFVPDGSGALIYLDSTKKTEFRYNASYYGGDKLVGATNYESVNNTVNNKMVLPVYGMKTTESTILGIIENGAETATLDAYISGVDNSEQFCKMKLTFDIQAQQTTTTDSADSFKIYRVSDDIYDDMITLRYLWLGEDAEYLDMANAYREYLEKTGELAAEDVEENAPFYVEILGVTDKTKHFLGIPYEGKQVVTTFKEAQEILTEMTQSGISNIKMIYSGMLNGGMNQRSLTGGVKFASDLGGSSAFKSLVSYAQSVGAEIYPNLLMQSAYTKSGLGGAKAAYDIVNTRGVLYEFDPVLNKVDNDSKYPQIIVNPDYIDSYLSKAKSSFKSKTGLTTLASNDLMTYYGTNYRGTQISLSTAEEIYKSALTELADGMTLMLSNPISEAYAYSSYLTDIPTTSGGARILDASVPFVQMVLDGYKTYSTESLNLKTTDIRETFMHAIETKSAPKFTFTYRDSSLLDGTKQDDMFAIDYNYWKDELIDWYTEYQEFYDAVKGETIVGHELYERNDKLRIVTYSNGVEIYFNYSDLDETINGVKVPAFSYVIEQ